MCYGLGCIYESPYDGRCLKPENERCSYSNNEEYLTRENLIEQVIDVLKSWAIHSKGKGLSEDEVVEFYNTLDWDVTYEIISQSIDIPAEYDVDLWELYNEAIKRLKENK